VTATEYILERLHQEPALSARRLRALKQTASRRFGVPLARNDALLAAYRRLVRDGARVVVSARRQALCRQVVAQIQERGGDAIALPADVAVEAQVERLIADTVAHYGRLDILVNNAGIGGGSRIAETSTDDFDRVLSVEFDPDGTKARLYAQRGRDVIERTVPLP
jgi:hypothetical protein